MLEHRVTARIARDFPAKDQTRVADLLSRYSGPEAERVALDILGLSKGSVERVSQLLKVARTDYRDILYWAEYYENDPTLRGGDPEKMVAEILAKWGEKSAEPDRGD
jgi:hypothetical protein